MEKIKPNVRLLKKDVEIDDRTEDYIYKRLEKIGKFNEKLMELEVEIDRDKKGKFRVELMAKTPYKLYRTEETTESIEGSIDIAVDEMKIQLTKDKDKMKELRERGARSIKKKTVIAEEARF